MTNVSITDLRPNLNDIANKVCFAGERFIVERNGKPAFALVSCDDLETLEALEDRIDLEDAKKALKEKGTIKHKDLRKKLGL
jgi:prevent-host-death family protein